MRVLAAVFSVLMVLFAAVQYNDPDALYWGAIYGVAALSCGLAALRPARIPDAGRVLLGVLLAAAAAGVVWYWPKTPEFWRKDVWWTTETAREGMGMMIAFVALLVAWLTVRRTPAAG